jgi:hypothetical protein
MPVHEGTASGDDTNATGPTSARASVIACRAAGGMGVSPVAVGLRVELPAMEDPARRSAGSARRTSRRR